MYMSTTNGSVKWFNKGAGYGFITASDGDRKGEDIFVHHSALTVSTEQFRYLVEGEHVSFNWVESGKDDSKSRWQASDVTGANGGNLMCETRNETQTDMQNSDASSSGERRHTRGSGGPRNQMRFRGGGPCVTDENGVRYRLVRDNRGNDHRGNDHRRNHNSNVEEDDASFE